MNRVCIQKTASPSKEAIFSILDKLEQIQIRSDESVIVKPNLCYHKDSYGMIVTNLKLIQGVIEWLRNYTDRITVVESDNRSGSADHRATDLGVNDLLRCMNVPFLNLSRERYLETSTVGDMELDLPKLVADAAYVVNLPKLKTCYGTTVTLSLKNAFGLIANRNKPSMHRILDKILLQINKSIRQQVILVDGVTGMEGNGPLLGQPVQTEILVAGCQPASVDATCARIMGFDPSLIGHIRTCAGGGLGEIAPEEIRVVGEEIQNVVREFAPPSFAPLSVARTIGSAAKLYLSR